MNSSYLQAEQRFLLVLNQFRQLLPESDMDEAEALVQAGELGAACEFFCNRIYDRGHVRDDVAVCLPEQFGEIRAVANAMDIDRMYWDFLNPNRPSA